MTEQVTFRTQTLESASSPPSVGHPPPEEHPTANGDSSMNRGSSMNGDAPMRRLLIISNDPDTRSAFLQHFLRNGCAVSTATRSETLRTLARHSTGYDFLLLDLADRANGFELLSQVQRALPDAVVLVTVDQAALSEGLKYVKLGADDFVVKPLPMRELEVRIEALLHRHTPSRQAPRQGYAIEGLPQGLTLDRSTRSCYRDGKCIALTSRQFDLLDHLFKNRGRTVSREALVKGVWGRPHTISMRTVDRHIRAIRQKIEDEPASPVYLQTVYGEGYQLTAAN